MSKPEVPLATTKLPSAYERAPHLLSDWSALERFRTNIVAFLSHGKGFDILEKIKNGKISIGSAVSELGDELDRIQRETHNS